MALNRKSIIKWLAKKKVVDNIATFRMRLGRGKGIYGDLREAVIIATALKVFNFSIPMIILLILVAHVGFYLIGWLDEKKIRLWLAENRYSYAEVNPEWQKLQKRVGEIHRRKQ